ncbi:allophanate hydrolase [Pseudocitrobacter cyperus]|uniref:Allophanate hydrolase n=1 Tax=Pseudocitrobacter cyperus TaxID=3112843 RepID=A0ABV0HFT9_9ENTR
MAVMIGKTLAEWQQTIASNSDNVFALLKAHLDSLPAPDNAWIALANESALREQIDALLPRYQQQPDALPLFGIPFAIKDNVDAAGWPTTAGCPAIAQVAERDATAVAKLKAAGAILLGKTNLDQFATGLVGTRSPYGAVANAFNPEYVSGGSSSGSASVVARGLVPFSLGTDTAGSGRVPAGFNNIVGLKPTKGWLSATGVFPACRLNDTLSVFALTVDDAWQVATIAGGYDAEDAYSRSNPATAPAAFTASPVLAIPDELRFFGDNEAEQAWQAALGALRVSGVTLKPIDFSPFYQLAEQLYQGPWVAERTAAVGDTLRHPEQMDPTVHTIIAAGLNYSAVETFNAEYLRAELARKIQTALADVDALVVPTSPTIHTIDEMAREPIRFNSEFGTYTNFTNLADLSALALPAPFRADGLPAGITLLAPAWHDRALAVFGRRWQQQLALPTGATGHAFPAIPPTLPGSEHHVRIAVVGAHLRGMPLNFQLTQRNAVFAEATETAASYRLYALANTRPPKPGLFRDGDGAAIEVELWDIPRARFGEFVAEIPSPLGIGSLELADGRWVKGFICEPAALNDATDITEFKGWRHWVGRKETHHV